MPTTPVQSKITFNDISTNAMSLYLGMTGGVEFFDEEIEVAAEEESGGISQDTHAVTVIGKSVMEFVPVLGFEMALFVVDAALKKIDSNPELHKDITMKVICNFAAITNMTIIASANKLAAYHQNKEKEKLSIGAPSQL